MKVTIESEGIKCTVEREDPVIDGLNDTSLDALRELIIFASLGVGFGEKAVTECFGEF